MVLSACCRPARQHDLGELGTARQCFSCQSSPVAADSQSVLETEQRDGHARLVSADAREGAEPPKQCLSGRLVRPQVPCLAVVVTNQHRTGADNVPGHGSSPWVQRWSAHDELAKLAGVGTSQLPWIASAEPLTEARRGLPRYFAADSLIKQHADEEGEIPAVSMYVGQLHGH